MTKKEKPPIFFECKADLQIEKFENINKSTNLDETNLDDLINKIDNVTISEKVNIVEKKGDFKKHDRRRTQLIGQDEVKGKQEVIHIIDDELEVIPPEGLLIDDLFFSNVPISDSEDSDVHVNENINEDDYTDPPYEVYNGWHWNSNKLEYCLKSNSGRIQRKLYVSPKIYGNLREHPHQYDGVRWMWNRFRRSEGGILADEMGLGKTIQVCVFIGALYRSEIATFIFLVLPASLISQWKEELDKWCPKIPKFIYHGNLNTRDEALKSLYSSKRGGILITTFETFRNDVHKLHEVNLKSVQCQFIRNHLGSKITPKDYLKEISQYKESDRNFNIPWDIVIIDEAHKLKNCKTKLFKDIKTLKSYCMILCTGTPFQNRLTELWSLIHCIKPNLLGKNIQAFNHNYAKHINRLNDRNILENEKKASELIISKLKYVIKPYILRRTKQIISQVNTKEINFNTQNIKNELSNIKKYDIVLWHNLSRDQSQSYMEVLDSHSVSTIINNSDAIPQNKQKNGAVLELIIYLLKVCKHPLLLLKPEFQSWRILLKNKKTATISTQNTLMFNSASKLPQLNIELLRDQSTKLQILNMIIPRLLKSNENKILVFSESLLMLDLIEITVLIPNKIDWERLEGKQSLDERNSSIDSFNKNNEKRILLLSKHIGSTGLNLTSANKIILVEPHWNPTQDEQAIGRAYRIGQKRDVIIYRLIAAGTIEDWKFRLQLHKTGLARIFLGGAKQEITFTNEELKCLFSYSEMDSNDIQEIIFKFNVNDKHYEILKNDIDEDCIKELEPYVMAYLDFENIQRFE
ncbi:SNF2 family N-terminal domain protein [Cryptosporidium meleagridis]|uniref:SNF2 family N-terminal domain protein n=1 Tax=Cryptosporidium meleagridis TaxID=93969 RepID=A0A2P4Z4Q8_9CRYT|nr:SNF2 family N-terminal domain protein [Cryptosporidium meleagridis]